MVLLDELFMLRRDRAIPYGRSVVYLLILAMLTGWWYRSDLAEPPPLPADGHAIASLSVAVNRGFCGFPSALSNDAQIGLIFVGDHGLIKQPIATVIRERWQTVEQYCATVTNPYLNNENSLMLLESWILRWVPSASVAELGWAMLSLKLGAVWLLCLALLRGGGSVFMCVGVVLSATAILHQLQPTFAYSVYSFFIPILVLPIAVYTLARQAAVTKRGRYIAAGVGGLVSAFGVNMRTSYLPIFVALFLVGMVAPEWRRTGSLRLRAARGSLVASLALVIVFVAAYGAFHYTFIVRTRPSGVASLSYHNVWHPMVLSLGAPPNALSEREGIVWNDGTGLVLARRVDPSVQYLAPGYEEALSAYYFGLWRKHPQEMRQIYIEKLKLAGRHMIDIAVFEDRWLKFVLATLREAQNGVWLLITLTVTGVVCLGAYLRYECAAALQAAQLACVGALLIVESAIIMPFYVLTYHQSLLFACAATVCLLAQVAISSPVVAAERLLGGGRRGKTLNGF